MRKCGCAMFLFRHFPSLNCQRYIWTHYKRGFVHAYSNRATRILSYTMQFSARKRHSIHSIEMPATYFCFFLTPFVYCVVGWCVLTEKPALIARPWMACQCTWISVPTTRNAPRSALHEFCERVHACNTPLWFIGDFRAGGCTCWFGF